VVKSDCSECRDPATATHYRAGSSCPQIAELRYEEDYREQTALSPHVYGLVRLYRTERRDGLSTGSIRCQHKVQLAV
jgi:hypothetical protein